GGGGASTHARTQTGHGGAVSYAGLVLDREDPQASVEQFLDQVVLLAVEGRSAQGPDGPDPVHGLAIGRSLDEVAVPRFLDALRDPVHRPVERLRLPPVGVGGPVEDPGEAVGVDGELERVRALRAEGPFVDRAAGVAFDVDDLAALHVDELPAPDGA